MVRKNFSEEKSGKKRRITILFYDMNGKYLTYIFKDCSTKRQLSCTQNAKIISAHIICKEAHLTLHFHKVDLLFEVRDLTMI